MDHGWAWQIEFEEHITRGYVHSSAFCTPDEAMRELKAKNPKIGDMRTIRFRSGRFDRFWINNVVAVGNSGGFVEPLEATALHMVIEHLRLLRQALQDAQGRILPEMVAIQNERFGILWDDVRDFLAIHYKFNNRLDTPFWRHCRADTALHGAQRLVDLYRVAGPTSIIDHLVPGKTIFGLQGYLSLMTGQRAPTEWREEPTRGEWQAYEQYRQRIRHDAASAIGVKEALQLVHSPHWQWSQPGR
jgi:tryptophan halogenase